MSPERAIQIASALILLLLSAFFSSAETTFFNLFGKGLIEEFEKKNLRPASRLKELLSSPGKLITSILIGNEIVNIIFSILIASIFFEIFLTSPSEHTERYVSYIGLCSMFLSTSLLLVFGETIPKTVGLKFSFQLIRYITEPFYWFHRIIFPLRWLFRRASEIILRLFAIKPGEGREEIKEGELVEILNLGEEEGILDETEFVLLKNIFEFGDMTAVEVMTPRQDVFSLPAGLEFAEFKKRFLESGYSRVPVYQGSPEQIIGVISVKDLMKIETSDKNKSIENFVRRPFCIPPQKKLNDLLKDFLAKRIHIALVVTEFGEWTGLVTLEDLLEEIFGESAEPEELKDITELGENRWEVLGRVELKNFNAVMNTDLHSPGVKTIAGFLLNEFGRVPSVDEELERGGYIFKIKEVKHRKISKIELRKAND